MKISLKKYVSIMESFGYNHTGSRYDSSCTTYILHEKDRKIKIYVDVSYIRKEVIYNQSTSIHGHYFETLEGLEKSLHKSHPQKSREIKLKRILDEKKN